MAIEDKGRGHVLVIGGGVAGSVFALFLKRAGISCSVYEAYPYTENVGGGLNIAPNGMSVLAELGLAEPLIARGTPTRDFVFQSYRGRQLARFRFGDPKRYGQPAVSMLRATLYQEVVRASRQAGIETHYEKRLVSIEESSSGVTAKFADGTSADGALLVGADGVQSAVRKYLLPSGPSASYVGVVATGGFPAVTNIPSARPNDTADMFYTFGPQGFFGYSGGNAGEFMWWVNLPRKHEYSADELHKFQWSDVQKELLDRFKGYPKPVEDLISATTDPLRLNIYDVQSLPRWHRGRVVLIGDAAHAVSPNAGQGASMALEDAEYLAKLLRDCDDYKQAFNWFEKDRKPRAEKIVAEGRARSSDKEIVSNFASMIRNLMIAIFVPLGKYRSDWILQYKIPWKKSGRVTSQ